MTQPARGNPREQRKRPTAQLPPCWIDADVVAAVKAVTPGYGELRAYVEKALRAQLAADATGTAAPPNTDTTAANDADS